MVRLIFILALLPLSAFGYTTSSEGSATLYTLDTEGGDGYRGDFVAAETVASDGDIIVFPVGTFDWTSGVTISGKGITIRGQGGGKIIGQSRTLNEFTTGTKTFTMHNASGNIDTSAYEFTVGETLRIYYPVVNDYLQGTVTSYSDPTLTMEITSVSGAGGNASGTDEGDEDFWIITRLPTTQIRRDYTVAPPDAFITITEDTTHNVIIEDIGIGRISGTGGIIRINGGGASGKPVIIRRCWFNMLYSNGVVIRPYVNRGVVSDCSFSAGFHRDAGASTCQMTNISFGSNAAWATASTMGLSGDPNGTENLYFEDCYFFGFRESLVDTDNNARISIRHSILDHSGIGGHGQGTSTVGARHWQYHDLVMLYKDDGSGRAFNPALGWFHPRGGTGIIYNVHIQSNASSSWTSGNDQAFTFMVEGVMDNSGIYACWGAGDSETTWPASDYPYPRQIGFGYVDGSGNTDPTHGYQGDPEPVYVWGITGSFETPGNAWTREFADTPTCTNPDSRTAYIKVDTNEDAVVEGDIIYNVAKPGWEAFTYPHPIAASVSAGATYGGRLRFNNTGAKPVRTDGVGQPIIFDQ